MTFGINTFLFTSPFTNSSTKLFRQFKAWGFDGVEIAIEDASHIDASLVRAQLDKHGLVCTSICGCFPPSRDLRGTRQQQLASIRYIKQMINIAEVLGTKLIIGPVFSSVGRADKVSRADYAKQWKMVVGHLKTICRYAEERNKVICLEPLNRFETDFVNTADQGLKMVRDVNSPALKLMLDTFHMNIEEKNLAEAIRRAGKHLAHFHASGSDRGTPGNDHVDWKGAAWALKEIGYNGPVVIESFTTDVEVIARAAAIWRKIEPNRNDIAKQGVTFLRKTFK